MRSALSLLLGIGILSILGIAFLLHSQNVSAAPATHIVISQIQVTGNGGADDEFVELYNPTSNPVDLSGWRLRKETSGGSFSNIVASMSGTVPAHGYFLIAFPGEYTGSVTPDLAYSATSSGIANNNTVLLYSDAAVTLVDKVGMGTATDFETAAALQPATGGSIQRLLDETNGHGKDTDNNSLDFETLETSSPRNSSTIVSPSPTPTVVPTITPANSPTNNPSPTNIPSPTASPMPASPTPTSTPTLTPTSTPNPTITITPSISPTPGVPTPTPKVITNGPIFKCTIHYKSWRFFHKTFFFPFIVCERASN